MALGLPPTFYAPTSDRGDGDTNGGDDDDDRAVGMFHRHLVSRGFEAIENVFAVVERYTQNEVKLFKAVDISGEAFEDKQRTAWAGCLVFGATAQGAPGFVHGGVLSMVFDCLTLGLAFSHHNSLCYTRDTTVKFHRYVPLYKPVGYISTILPAEPGAKETKLHCTLFNLKKTGTSFTEAWVTTLPIDVSRLMSKL
mmetsp:Transcript_46558/g.109539  ORF Transcript_46558/g.109539 Transcript_46558/m.109539 type:complete len:196 (-) Transcript_46558:119-706(-)